MGIRRNISWRYGVRQKYHGRFKALCLMDVHHSDRASAPERKPLLLPRTVFQPFHKVTEGGAFKILFPRQMEHLCKHSGPPFTRFPGTRQQKKAQQIDNLRQRRAGRIESHDTPGFIEQALGPRQSRVRSVRQILLAEGQSFPGLHETVQRLVVYAAEGAAEPRQ